MMPLLPLLLLTALASPPVPVPVPAPEGDEVAARNAAVSEQPAVAREAAVGGQPEIARNAAVGERPEVARPPLPHSPTPPLAVQRLGPWSNPDSSPAKRRIVVLDAGHGGRDPGRTGPDGVREKDLTLKLVRRLRDELRDRGYEVHLTRDADTLISLADRPRFANHWKRGRPQAVFVSIHINAGDPGDTRSTGFETYFLSDARTADERRVAEMENAAGDYEDTPAHAAPAVESILNGLRNDYYVRASDDLAELIQRRIARIHPGPNRGVKRAGFRVLIGAIMPAVLVESGFISNRQEERWLATGRAQRRLVGAVADALDQFFARHAWAAEAGQ